MYNITAKMYSIFKALSIVSGARTIACFVFKMRKAVVVTMTI